MAAWNEFVRRRYPGDFLQLLLNRGPFTYCVSQNGGFVDTLSSAMIINCRPPLPADVICEQPITLELELIWYGCSWDIGRFQYFHTNNRLLATTCIHKIATFFNSSYILVFICFCIFVCVFACLCIFVFVCIWVYQQPPASTSSPPFPIIGLNLHPKLIIGSQGSYGLKCGLNEAIENLPSSLMCIIFTKYYPMKFMKLFTHKVSRLCRYKWVQDQLNLVVFSSFQHDILPSCQLAHLGACFCFLIQSAGKKRYFYQSVNMFYFVWRLIGWLAGLKRGTN